MQGREPDAQGVSSVRTKENILSRINHLCQVEGQTSSMLLAFFFPLPATPYTPVLSQLFAKEAASVPSPLVVLCITAHNA